MNHEFTVLIIEDTYEVAQWLSICLRYFFKTITCHTLSSATETLNDDGHEIHAILLDVMLPNGQGKATVAKLRSQFPKIPIVPISGYNFKTEEMIEAGAQDFIHKPFQPEVLVEKLTNAISRNKAWKKIAPILMEDVYETSSADPSSSCTLRATSAGSPR